MDRKSIIILAVTGILFLTWSPLINKIFPPIPAPPGSTNAPTAGTNQIALPPTTISAAPTNAVLSPAPALTNALAGTEETLSLENQWARLQFTSVGGGIKLVELKQYKSFVGCKADKLATNPPASINKRSAIPMFTISGADAALGDNSFHLSTASNTVRAERTLTNGILLVKEFQILSNYQLKATFRWENRSAQPAVAPARQLVIGSSAPIGAFDDITTIGLDWFDGSKANRITRTEFEPSNFLFLYHRPGKSEYSGGTSNVVWAATHNQFFTAIVTPKTPAPRVLGHAVDFGPPSPDELHGDARTVVKPRGILGSLAYADVVVPAGQSFVEEFHAYLGPKEYKTLQGLQKDVDKVMNMDGFWGWFAKMLLLAMNGLHSFGISYGWAIVLITIILKIAFYPLTAASTRSMKRMSTLQPQMKAIQEKYKDDPTKMNQKLQEFMKEHRINPLGSCLPILLTIPIFAGFYFMLRSAIELRGENFLWACDLAAPDTLFVIPGFGIPFNGFAFLMVATMMWQSHMTPASPGIDPTQQKMMRYMPLIIVPFIYNQGSGLTLYWTVQNLLSILQMKLTQDKPEQPSGKPGTPAPATVHRRKG